MKSKELMDDVSTDMGPLALNRCFIKYLDFL